MANTVSSNGITADYTITPEGLADILDVMTENNRPVMIWGPPGIGKSAIAYGSSVRNQRHYVDVRAMELEPVDTRGLPTIIDGRTKWATPNFLPPEDSDERFLINLEELPAAPLSVQTALYRLVLDREAGDDYKLPDGAAVVACGNRLKDGGQVYKMPKALANRFRHVELRPDVDEWMTWALTDGNLKTEVVAFIRFRPELLFDFQPRSEEHAFPTPRSWEFVSQDVGLLPADLEMAMIRGTVGEGAAVEFQAFLDVYRHLPDPSLILNNPEGAEIPSGKSALIATCTGLARVAAEEDMDAVTTYAGRLQREIGEYLVSTTVKAHPECQYTRSFLAWCQATA